MAEESHPKHRRRLPRIAHLTSAHPWQDPRIFLKECRSLIVAGRDVSLIAQRAGDAKVDGVSCLAIPSPSNRFTRMLVTPWRIFSMALRFDVCHFHDPELIPIAVALKLCGKTVIYDVHEDLPRQILVKHWIPKPIRAFVAKLAAGLEYVAGRVVDGVVAATPTIAERFPIEKTVLVRNYPILDAIISEGPEYNSRPNVIVYVGAISAARGARQMVNVMPNLKSENVRLHLAGAITPTSLSSELSIAPGWQSVVYHGTLGRAGLVELLQTSRAGLVLLEPSQNYVEALPTKMFEYMAAGLPVIASAFPIWKKILSDCDAGIVVDPMNVDEIASAIRFVLQNPAQAEAMGRRGRTAVLEQYNWSQEAKKLVKFYAALAA